MSSDSAAAFAATQAIKAGDWDRHIDQIIPVALERRKILRDRSKPPPKTREMMESGTRTWAWMNGPDIPHWEVVWTGAIVPEELRRRTPEKTDG